MSDPFIGEIQAFAFNFGTASFHPTKWLPCDGQLLPVQSNTALFSLIGYTYGGNGSTMFALPNLNGRITVSQGQGSGLTNRVIGESVGTDAVTLTKDQMAPHRHPFQLAVSATPGGQPGPGVAGVNTMLDPAFNGFVDPSLVNTQFAENMVDGIGGGGAHSNEQPTQALRYYIAVDGLFPSFD